MNFVVASVLSRAPPPPPAGPRWAKQHPCGVHTRTCGGSDVHGRTGVQRCSHTTPRGPRATAPAGPRTARAAFLSRAARAFRVAAGGMEAQKHLSGPQPPPTPAETAAQGPPAGRASRRADGAACRPPTHARRRHERPGMPPAAPPSGAPATRGRPSAYNRSLYARNPARGGREGLAEVPRARTLPFPTSATSVCVGCRLGSRIRVTTRLHFQTHHPPRPPWRLVLLSCGQASVRRFTEAGAAGARSTQTL